MNYQEIYSQLGIPIWAIILAIAWTLTWKGIALWKSARKNSPVWFVILLLVNTLGILEILYIFLFSEMQIDSAKEKNRSPKREKKKKKKT